MPDDEDLTNEALSAAIATLSAGSGIGVDEIVAIALTQCGEVPPDVCDLLLRTIAPLAREMRAEFGPDLAGELFAEMREFAASQKKRSRRRKRG